VSRHYIEHDVEQRTDAWHALRAARVNGSTARAVLAKVGKGEAAARRDLRVQLALETVLETSLDERGFVSFDMERGSAFEPEGRTAYEMATGRVVREVGFISSTRQPIGYSPDGVIGDYGDYEGLLELKVPRSATHWGYLQDGGTGPHSPQLLHALHVCHDVPWIDFVSYDPRFPPGLQLVITHVTRAVLDLDGYATALDTFLVEVDETAAAIAAKIKDNA
jgi:hypothetical protein